VFLTETTEFTESNYRFYFFRGAKKIKTTLVSFSTVLFVRSSELGERVRNKLRSLTFLLLVSVFCLFPSAFLWAQGPAWWYSRGAVDTNLNNNDYTPVACGQLKWMATNAFLEMEEYFGAGTDVTAVVNSFSSSNNYYPANIGQVKYVARPFYDRLYEMNLTNCFPANMPGHYPWGNSAQTNDFCLANIGQVKYVFSFDSDKDSDGDGYSDWSETKWETDPYSNSSFPHADISGLLTYAGQQTGTIYVVLATNGVENGILEYQTLSQPDSFTFTNLPAMRTYWLSGWRDSDGDGSNDFWEAQGSSTVNLTGNGTYATIVLSDPDSDGDGLSDWLEFVYGTNPYNSDTDGDGLSDKWEIDHGLDPLSPDTDGDGLSDGWEVTHGYDPSNGDDSNTTIVRESARQKIIRHYKLIYGMTPVFTNTSGSQADLIDMRNALNALSGKFYEQD